MAGAELATVGAIMKEVYGPRIESQMQEETVTKKRIERTSEGVTETIGGKYVDFPIRVKRNHGIGYRAEDADLPTAGRQGFTEVHIPLRYGYGRIRLTEQVISLAKTNTQAFANAMDDEMDHLKTDLAKDENRIAYGDSTGQLAAVTADAGANEVVVDTVQYLEVGMIIDIMNVTTDVAIATSREITAINEDTLTVTYSGADITPTTDHVLVRAGSWEREPSGFGNIIDDTLTLHTVDPSVQPKWAAIVNDNGGVNRALSEGLMIRVCDDIRRKSGRKPTVIFQSLGVRRAYFNLLTQQRRYNDTKEFAGGFVGLPFNYGTEIPVVEDVDCPANTMYFVDESAFKVYRSKEWHWADEDGNVLKWVTDKDSWTAFMRQFSEFATSHRNAHARLEDITEG